jgi:DNA-binding CsgD family transcriptional regulator
MRRGENNPTGMPQGQPRAKLKGGKSMARQSKISQKMMARMESGSSIVSGLLSTLELKILARMAGGDNNKQIAESLSIDPVLVDTLINGIFRKVQAPNRLQAILWAARYL